MWACREHPIKFIDVVGEEKTRTVATEDSAPQSKYNTEEVREAVSWSRLCRHILTDEVVKGSKASWTSDQSMK